MKWFAKRLLGKAMWVLTCVMVLVLVEGHAAGQCVEQKLLASDGAGGDWFGSAVSISGSSGNEVAIVGAIFHDGNGDGSGSAYIYRKSGTTWVQEAKLLASDGAEANNFGNAVSISGTPGNEVAIIGARFDNDNGLISGSAYIFRKIGRNWVQEAKLLASDGASFDIFGISVSISGTPGNEVAIVGAYGDNDNGSSSGSAYIFHKTGTTWIEEAKLLASDGARNDNFGRSVSIGGSPGNLIAIIGARKHNHNDNRVALGSAFIFRKNGANWIQEDELLPFSGVGGHTFGSSVSISGAPGNEVAIIGAFLDRDNGLSSGSAFIFRKSGTSWVQEVKLLASDGVAFDQFGVSVSISGAPGNEVAVVGARGVGDNGMNSGSAYIFRKTGPNWVQEVKLLAPNGEAFDNFGNSVSISGNPGKKVAIVGSPLDNDSANNSGAAYIYELPCSPDCSADLNNDGFVNVSDLLLLLGARDPGPPGSQGDRPFNVTDLLALLAAWGPCP